MINIFNASKKVLRFFKDRLQAIRPACFGGLDADEEPELNNSNEIKVTRIASCSLPEMRGITLEAALEELSKQKEPPRLNLAIPTKSGDNNDAIAQGKCIAALLAAKQKQIHEKMSPRRRQLSEQKSIEERYCMEDTFSRAFGRAFYLKAVENYWRDEPSGLISAVSPLPRFE